MLSIEKLTLFLIDNKYRKRKKTTNCRIDVFVDV